MNFYIGNCAKEIDRQSENVYFSAEFSEYLFERQDTIDADLQWLFDIDPYDIGVIDVNIVPKIILSCNNLHNHKVWEQYDFPEDGLSAVEGLLALAQKALSLQVGLISFGD